MQCHVSLRFPRGAHDTVACEGFYLGDNVAFAEGVSVCLRGRGFAGMLMMHRPYRSEPIADCIVGVRCHGSLNAATVRVGEVFREAVRANCASIIVVHNHPSGDPTPSPEDVRTTEMIVEAGQLLDIEVLDHLVIGRNCYVSLKERKLGFK